MLPVAAARATKSKTSSARLQRARPDSPRAWAFQARHSKSKSGNSRTPGRPRFGKRVVRRLQIGGEAAGRVNTDFSGRHARTTKRAGPERAFERDALTVATRASAFPALASAHSRTQGRNAQNSQDATIANRDARTCEALAGAKTAALTFISSQRPEAGRRTPATSRVSRRWCSHLRAVARRLPCL